MKIWETPNRGTDEGKTAREAWTKVPLEIRQQMRHRFTVHIAGDKKGNGGYCESYTEDAHGITFGNVIFKAHTTLSQITMAWGYVHHEEFRFGGTEGSLTWAILPIDETDIEWLNLTPEAAAA